MITIVKFKVFDKSLEKNFYNGETIEEINRTLNEISDTYIPMEVITAERKESSLLNELKNHKQKTEKLLS